MPFRKQQARSIPSDRPTQIGRWTGSSSFVCVLRVAASFCSDTLDGHTKTVHPDHKHGPSGWSIRRRRFAHPAGVHEIHGAAVETVRYPPAAEWLYGLFEPTEQRQLNAEMNALGANALICVAPARAALRSGPWAFAIHSAPAMAIESWREARWLHGSTLKQSRWGRGRA